MNPFEMVVLIVAIVIAGSVLRARVASSRTSDDDAARVAGSAETARLAAEIDRLKRRVATLERIATDRSTTLDHEIEALRDRTLGDRA